jgi:protein-S-isoprenylcysteine O-methyltransferase Ste14
MKRLNAMGIGPKIGGITLPWLAVAIFFTLRFKGSFDYFIDEKKILFFFGLTLIVIGSILYLITAPLLLKGLRETKLITSGSYYLCCNPLYTSVLLFIIPGISFIMNSWLILSASIIGYLMFKLFIKSEYAEMENFFGDEYRKYRSETPEFLPFPMKKLFRSS